MHGETVKYTVKFC